MSDMLIDNTVSPVDTPTPSDTLSQGKNGSDVDLTLQDTRPVPVPEARVEADLALQDTRPVLTPEAAPEADPALQDTQPVPTPEAVSKVDIALQETRPVAVLDVEPAIDLALQPTVPTVPVVTPSALTTTQVATKRQKRRPRSKRERRLRLFLLCLLIATILTPIGFLVSYGITAYTTYNTLHDEAYSGLQHLLNIKTIFTGVQAHPSGFLDSDKLHRTQKELAAARNDFQQVQYTLDHASIISLVTQFLPQYRSQISATRAASQIGLDVTSIGQQVVGAALVLAPSLQGSLLVNNGKPLVTQSTLDLIHQTIAAVVPLLSDIQAHTQGLAVNTLPISADKQTQFLQLVQLIPQAVTDLTQVQDLLGAVGWVLGVDGPRTFLVQTMDRAELRPTGGFTGQYGELKISAGRIAPFSLRDISFIEYANNSPTTGQLAPQQYRAWWPFANWGLRDSNVSADFPTSAQLAISNYTYEAGHAVDGVILFTPFLIEHVLNVIGPLQIPAYHETITAQNLEERLHYYQQDNAGILKQEIIEHVNDPSVARKLFTSTLSKILIDQIRHAPPDELVAIGLQMLYDLKTKDLQVYATDPQVEGLLMHYGDAAQIDRSTTHDGLYVVQANLSASKASQYVRTSLQDTVTVDAAGGATHLLTMRLAYTQLGPVYGLDTYRDYVRVYVPSNSTLLWGDGFDTGTPLCGGRYAACPQEDVYPQGELLCPAGQFQAGAAAPMITDPFIGQEHPLDTVGPPTNLLSDEPGRAMFGGWVIVPKNCTATVTLSWHVPPLAPSGQSYSLLVQRQAGTFPELDLTLLPSPSACMLHGTTGLHFDGPMAEDMSFALSHVHPAIQTRASCYPQPGPGV